ncbi:MAG: beta-lactamase family protein [Rhodospirillales bacterium]|nr:MAG: beta-lactamase family protein [Rhodospirillales bacterium]
MAVAFLVGLASPAAGQGLPWAKTAEDVGVSTVRLRGLTDRLREGVRGGEIPGAVAIVVRNGKVVYFESFGFRDREARASMKVDSIFRIASMTKPVVSLAVMMLAEEGRLSIAEPASKYLPELKDLKVGVERRRDDGAVELELVPARREMTIHDLLRHTSGLTYGVFDDSAVDRMYLAANVTDGGQTNAELVSKLAKLPLKHQPGTTWEYSLSTDVLGRLVEVVSGQALDEFVAERITGPLKMPDTGFHVDDSRRDRVAQPMVDPRTGRRMALRRVDERPRWLSGGGGMLSTAADYARFGQFWLNGGQLDGVRLLSRKSVELMTANHLPPGTAFTPAVNPGWGEMAPSPEAGQGFGLGFATRRGAGGNPLHGSSMEYYWAGAMGTSFVIDPAERLVAVLMIQAPAQMAPYRAMMRQHVAAALVD